MDLTREEEGAQVTAATSFDPNFPPSNILDGLILSHEHLDTCEASKIESENVKLGDASFIKFKILSGWTDFVTLNRVSVEGSTSRR
ncbi:hypothetical protein FI667_g12491, partial [Globisporangium splendens]